MVNMCEIITPYRCKNCGQDMLFFLTNNNTLIDYKALFCYNDQTLYGIKHYLENKNIRFIKCLVCNKTYIIDWTHGYPMQLLNKDLIKKFGV